MKQENWKKGNRRLLSALLIGAVLLCGGCGREAADQQGQDEAWENVNTETAETEDVSGNASGQTQETPAEGDERETEEITGVRAETGGIREQRIKNTGNETLLTMKTNTVSVTVPENREAEEAVSLFLADRQASWRETAEIYRGMAEEDFAAWAVRKAESDGRDSGSQEEGQEEPIAPERWNAYELDRICRVTRADEEIISILEEVYIYTGGEYGNTVRTAYNFDARTGKRMTLEEVASDLDEIRQKSTEYLGKKLTESEIAGELYGDYANHLEDILTDSTWYLDGNGLHVICNESVIAPRSVGVLDFLLPYEEVDVVKERFQLAG